MGTKHSAAKTPRTAPMTPALGRVGHAVHVLERDGKRAVRGGDEDEQARPYHTDRFAGSAEPSMPSSAPSPSNARVVTLRTRPRGTPRARGRARARGGRGAERTSSSRRRSRRTRRRWGDGTRRARAPPAVATTARRGATPVVRSEPAFARSDAPPARARVAPRTAREANIKRAPEAKTSGRRRAITRARRGRRRGGARRGCARAGARWRVCRASGRTREAGVRGERGIHQLHSREWRVQRTALGFRGREAR